MDKYVALIRQILPFPRSSSLVNPEPLFKQYEERADAIETALKNAVENERREVIDRIYRIYDNDRSRKESIDRRAEIVLLVNGAALAIFVPVTWTVFLAATRAGEEIATYCLFLIFIGLSYMGVSVLVAAEVHQRIMRNIVGVEELIRSDGTLVDEPEYARRMLKMIIANWKINNIWAERLETARRLLKNGVAASFLATVIYLVSVIFES